MPAASTSTSRKRIEPYSRPPRVDFREYYPQRSCSVTPPSDQKAVVKQDHRKNKRNRATVSCYRCHKNKRGCKRKEDGRCERCEQLNLECVYENGRNKPITGLKKEDEIERLKGRVEELETVIRLYRGGGDSEIDKRNTHEWLLSVPEVVYRLMEAIVAKSKQSRELLAQMEPVAGNAIEPLKNMQTFLGELEGQVSLVMTEAEKSHRQIESASPTQGSPVSEHASSSYETPLQPASTPEQSESFSPASQDVAHGTDSLDFDVPPPLPQYNAADYSNLSAFQPVMFGFDHAILNFPAYADEQLMPSLFDMSQETWMTPANPFLGTVAGAGY